MAISRRGQRARHPLATPHVERTAMNPTLINDSPALLRVRRRWITDREPENEEVWAGAGRRTARRNRTTASGALLLVPIALMVRCVTDPARPYWLFLLASLTVHRFPLFLFSFQLLFVARGVGNGSTYRKIPAIFRAEAMRVAGDDPDAGSRASARGRTEAAAVISLVSAIGAFAGFSSREVSACRSRTPAPSPPPWWCSWPDTWCARR
jgi:hypothetical protein